MQEIGLLDDGYGSVTDEYVAGLCALGHFSRVGVR